MKSLSVLLALVCVGTLGLAYAGKLPRQPISMRDERVDPEKVQENFDNIAKEINAHKDILKALAHKLQEMDQKK